MQRNICQLLQGDAFARLWCCTTLWRRREGGRGRIVDPALRGRHGNCLVWRHPERRRGVGHLDRRVALCQQIQRSSSLFICCVRCDVVE